MERGRVEINKQSTSGLHQSKNGMGTYYIQNSFIHIIIAKHVYYSSVRYTTETH